MAFNGSCFAPHILHFISGQRCSYTVPTYCCTLLCSHSCSHYTHYNRNAMLRFSARFCPCRCVLKAWCSLGAAPPSSTICLMTCLVYLCLGHNPSCCFNPTSRMEVFRGSSRQHQGLYDPMNHDAAWPSCSSLQSGRLKGVLKGIHAHL